MVGFAVLGLVGCAAAEPTGGTETGGDPPEGSETAAAGSGDGAAVGQGWFRVNLGFVSAYVLVRGGEAALVDTGTSGSAEAVGAVLTEAGTGWDRLRHVILTHKHDDHAGGAVEVLREATNATGYVGEADLAALPATKLSALRDGDEVFGLQIVGTPGHTAGHMAVWEPESRVLVAGDALNNDGALSGANPQYSEDMNTAAESVRKLATLAPATILVGHGSPLEDAAAQLTRLAAST